LLWLAMFVVYAPGKMPNHTYALSSHEFGAMTG